MKKEFNAKSVTPEKQHAADVWLQILIPILVVSVGSLAAGLLLTQASMSNTQIAAQWAHISIIFLILPLVFVGVLILTLLLLLSHLTKGLHRVLPPRLFAVRINIDRIAKSIQFRANKPAHLVISLRGLLNGISTIFQKFSSFRRKHD